MAYIRRGFLEGIQRVLLAALVVIALAIFCKTIVLPARGGEVIKPRWPLPIGASRLTSRVVRLVLLCSRSIISSG